MPADRRCIAMPKTPKNLRSGSKWNKVARAYKAECAARNDVCWRCHGVIDYTAEARTAGNFELDHSIDVS